MDSSLSASAVNEGTNSSEMGDDLSTNAFNDSSQPEEEDVSFTDLSYYYKLAEDPNVCRQWTHTEISPAGIYLPRHRRRPRCLSSSTADSKPSPTSTANAMKSPLIIALLFIVSLHGAFCFPEFRDQVVESLATLQSSYQSLRASMWEYTDPIVESSTIPATRLRPEANSSSKALNPPTSNLLPGSNIVDGVSLPPSSVVSKE